jgi:hypothetical protein
VSLAWILRVDSSRCLIQDQGALSKIIVALSAHFQRLRALNAMACAGGWCGSWREPCFRAWLSGFFFFFFADSIEVPVKNAGQQCQGLCQAIAVNPVYKILQALVRHMHHMLSAFQYNHCELSYDLEPFGSMLYAASAVIVSEGDIKAVMPHFHAPVSPASYGKF